MSVHVSEPPINQSVERAARMLELFSVDEPELTLSQITSRMGLNKATAHRYATALRRAGLMRASNGLYTLGPRIGEAGRLDRVGGPLEAGWWCRARINGI